MIDVRIVCTHDGVKTAETLMRLLEAEQHCVQLTFGRQALGELAMARDCRDAVVLIWSPAAPHQHYMLEWARHTDPARLVEISRAGAPPKLDRKNAVIDFTAWRGERGGRAWSQLNERLRLVARALEPPKPPPKHAALALGLASMAAVSGAVMVRLSETTELNPRADMAATNDFAIATVDPADGVGGAVYGQEPPSVDDLIAMPRLRPLRAPMLQMTPARALTPLTAIDTFELRDPTLIERLREFNPLRSLARDTAEDEV